MKEKSKSLKTTEWKLSKKKKIVKKRKTGTLMRILRSLLKGLRKEKASLILK